MGHFPHRGRDIVICLVLIGLTLAAYASVRQYPFVDYDDPEYVSDNAVVKRGLTLDGVRWALTSSYSNNWHPLTWLSLMLDCQLFGVRAGPMHIHNVLLHAANACLLFWVLRRMTGATWCSALAAALFVWHPLRVESVAWIAERKDVLSTLFWLLTLWAWLRFTERRTAWRYALALLAFVFGLMSKPMVVTLPFVLVLLDVWPLKRLPVSSAPMSEPTPTGQKAKVSRAPLPAASVWKQLILEKAPFFALSLATSVVTLRAQRGAMSSGESLSAAQRVANAAVAVAEYLRKFFWPDDLAVFYPHPGQWPWWRVGVAIAVLAAVSAVSLWQRRSRPYLLVGWLWYVGTLVPVLGLTQVGGQAWADRYTYVPMIGVAIMIAWGAADMAARWQWPTAVRLAPVAVGLAACWAVTALQVRYWQSTLTLFTHALEVTQNNHRAHKEVADVYSAAKQFAAANHHYEEALRIKPHFFNGQMQYGISLGDQGKFQAAIPHFLAAIQINPDSAEAHNDVGVAYEITGSLDEAMQHYREAMRIRPENPTAQRNLSRLLAKRQQDALGKP